MRNAGVRAIVALALLAVFAAPVLALAHCGDRPVVGAGAVTASDGAPNDCAIHEDAANAAVSTPYSPGKSCLATAVATLPPGASPALSLPARGECFAPRSPARLLHSSQAFTCLFLI